MVSSGSTVRTACAPAVPGNSRPASNAAEKSELEKSHLEKSDLDMVPLPY
jgi:hypothetical protein